jgi:branched-chain amino acid transport system substrate-binding protein
LYQGAYSEDLRWPEPRPEPVAPPPIDAEPSQPIAEPRRLPLGPIAAVAILGFATLALWFNRDKISQSLCQLPGLGPCSPEVIRALDGPLASRLSLGDKILIKQAQNPPLKEQAAQAMRQGDYREAVRIYSKSLEQFKNDPEAVIYLNNAHAIQGPYLKVALAVPIGSNPKVAQQMMRGIAHYQTEVNQGEGINGKQLVVQIANDDNKAGPAEEIAKALVKDPTVLAIIGHNATNASLAAAPIYQTGGLPMVMPTSVATQLTGIGSYIFRASATAKAAAETEADYLIKQGYQNLGICYDSNASDNQSYRDELGVVFERRGGRISSISCDVATPGFDPIEAVDTAIARKIDVLALAPHIDHIDRVLPIAVAAHGKLPLISSSTMNTDEVLAGGSAVDGLVMPTAWHPWQADGQVFAKKAEKFWGGRVIWRTAMTYDATAAVVAGLRRSSTRDGLQQALTSPGFEAQGSGAPFRFNPKTHDRVIGMSMIQVRKDPNAAHGYDFRPITVRPSAN